MSTNIDNTNRCYIECIKKLCNDKECNECQIIKDKNYPEMNTILCNSEIDNIKKSLKYYNNKYKQKCKYFNNEDSCENNFEQRFISESLSNYITYNIFKGLTASKEKLDTEEQTLLDNIVILYNELYNVYNNQTEIINSQIKELIESNKIDIKTKLKETLKILQLTLISIKNKYIPEPNIEKEDIKTKINLILLEIKQVLIIKELNKNYKLISLLLWIIDLYDNNNLDYKGYYNFLSDIYITIHSYNETYKTSNETIQQILLSENNSFIKINDENPTIEYINQEEHNTIEEYKLKKECKISIYSFYNTGSNCFFSSALQLLYNVNSFKSYIYDDDKIRETFNLSENITNIKDIISDLKVSDKSYFNLNIENIEKIGFDISNISSLSDIENNESYNKVLSLILIYYIRIIFEYMDNYIKTESKKEEEIRYKFIPFLRSLLKDSNDKNSYEKTIIINKEGKLLNVNIKIIYKEEDTTEYITKILDYVNFNKILSFQTYKEKVYNDKKNNYVNIIQDKTELSSKWTFINLDLNKYIINNKDDTNINIYKLLDTTFMEEDSNNFRNLYNDVITYSRIKYNNSMNSLILIINRNSNEIVRFNGVNPVYKKIDNPVNINKEITLNSYIINTSSKEIKYRIKSIIVHYGNTGEGGHYYIYVYDKDDKWYKYDDISRDNKRIKIKMNITDNNVKLKEEETTYVLHYELIE